MGQSVIVCLLSILLFSVISFKHNRHGFANDSLLPHIAALRIPCLSTVSTNVGISQQVVNRKAEPANIFTAAKSPPCHLAQLMVPEIIFRFPTFWSIVRRCVLELNFCGCSGQSPISFRDNVKWRKRTFRNREKQFPS
jgi:hypothetical protein